MSAGSCATADLLAQWLEGALNPSEAAQLDEHIELCSCCQTQLERLTRCHVSAFLETPISERWAELATTLRQAQHEGTATDPDGMNSSASPAVPKGRFGESFPQVSGYEVLELLGRGGMGRVYLARHVALNRSVAIKVIAPHLAEHSQFIARLQLEARSLASVKHPNIVQVFDVVDVAGQPALILEYVPDGTLSSRCEQRKLTQLEACRIAEQICRGVHASHVAGIIHRDLKPANVLMDGMIPKVTDFGLALNAPSEQRLTAPGECPGTPEYMAPEQIREGVTSSSPSSDVYSLGAILYELLTGQPPFVGKTLYQTLEMAANSPVTPPQRHCSEISDDLNDICLRALNKQPDHRFSSAAEMADALANASTKRRHIADLRKRSARLKWVMVLAGITLVVMLLFSLINGSRALKDSAATPNSPAEQQDVLLPAGSLWKGTYKFLPADSDVPDGEMELQVDERSNDTFKGTYYSEQREFAWRIEGAVHGNELSWNFVSAIRDNSAGDVVGVVRVSGTLNGDRISALWSQNGESARLNFVRIQPLQAPLENKTVD